MTFTKKEIAFRSTGQFSALFLDYIEKAPALSNLYTNHFSYSDFQAYLKQQTFEYVNRSVLHAELKQQNNTIDLSNLTQKNIDSLQQKNTFTITTGHQLCLFTGPLYFIYKIITCINVCDSLNKQFPDKHFVPVYWMASEDHDFEEINHSYVFGKKVIWNSDQKGKVGDFNTEGINNVIEELSSILGDSENAANLIELFRQSYSKKTLSEATRFLVNSLFGKYGLVILDGDSKTLKKLFIPEIKKELESGFSYAAVNNTNAYLKSNNYSTQVNPREINLFYAENGKRERIEKSENTFKVLNTDLVFNAAQMEDLLKTKPEVFSPNVILRPLYQQKILPNIAYAGGPGEIAYWLQLKGEFDVSGIHFPVLVPRKFALILDKSISSKLDKLNISYEEIFQNEELLIKKLISTDDGRIDFNEEKTQLNDLFRVIKSKAESTDKTLAGAVEGELQKTLKGIENIEQKIIRALKAKNETSLNQIKTIKQKLFPDGSIQERYDNFSAFFIKNPDLIEDLISVFSDDVTSLSRYLILNEN